ncbi:MAG: hypothetical protein A3J93_01360 [Candidatus Magasanikbacteria bacterium RIFOXYC2_FULL_42_28]|uniref:Nudix hydrolase domain-containing protein n=1 Tax=Candidatus Magasanikbacteria bacterium RIFOXYC2_FULL_42_28 TaxID=1798704 RepID=A0A1F6NXT8_9BACT|nr:MAG: hypothetical protein A3J93_01360 [Candidatus Magasanikbacteria bacterium RIFOXYC2_FULL_42_28]
MYLPPNSIIASGPVIIENGKVLLDRENKNGKITDWFFPGGGVEDFDISLEETCRREVREEMGIEIEIIRPLDTLLTKEDGHTAILVHYLAKRIGEIKPGADIADWAWHDIKNLPDNCAPNVYEIVNKIINI